MGYKIINSDVGRVTLSEGRSYGVGFSMLKFNSDNTFKKVIPFTACKDYLNDVVHIEKYNTITGKIHGLEYSNNNYFEYDKEHGYVGVCALNKINISKETIDQDLKVCLEENIENVVNVLNYFEKRLNIKPTELIYSKDTYVLKSDRYWVNETFLISLYTLIIRYYANFNKKVNVIQLLKHKPLVKDDEYLFNKQIKILLFENISTLKKYKKTDYKYPEGSTIGGVHNFGIKTYSVNEENNKRKL